MSNYFRPLSVFFVAAVLVCPVLARAVTVYEKDDFKLMLSGHLQELSQSSEDVIAEELNEIAELVGGTIYPRHTSSNTTRCRLTLRMLTGTAASAEVSVDETYTFGSVLDSPLFLIEKEMEPPTYYNWEYTYADGDGRYGQVSVYRAMLTLEWEKARMVIGRQRLAYGTALFWSPVDIWNPVSPLALEPEEKIGVDGVSGIWWATDDLTVTGLAAMADEWDEARLAASGSLRVGSYTFDLLAGKRFRDQVYGFDFVGYLGEAGVRGEFTYTVADEGDDYPRAVAGMDYAWPSSLYAAFEYYHNGGPIEIDLTDPLGSLMEFTGVDTLYRNFLGGMLSYDLDPLVKGSLFMIEDLDKGSWVLAPGFAWYASNSLTISGGGQFFGGAKDGEFGEYPALGYARIRVDF